MNKPDNTLKILVTVSSILFLLIAIKTSYPADDIWDRTLNIAGKFITYELLLFLTIYIAGPMVSEVIPGLWEYRVKAKHKLITVTHKDSPCQLTQLPEENDQSAEPIYNESSTLGNIEAEDIDRKGSELNTIKSKEITVLSEEIINYVTKTFENILTPENIEKLLNNFRMFNAGGPYEVIEKKKLDKVFEFDLAHFAWNVCKRIYDKNLCPLIFTIATAEMIKASFPLTLLNYETDTLKQRLRDSIPTTKFRLPIIELGEELIPFDWNKKNIVDKNSHA